MIYRGYELSEEGHPGKWIVKKDGVLIAVLLGSEEAALNWIDAERKRQLSK